MFVSECPPAHQVKRIPPSNVDTKTVKQVENCDQAAKESNDDMYRSAAEIYLRFEV